MSQAKDRNFDGLIDRFEQKVYGTLKGEWRLKLIKEDLARFHVKPSNSSDALQIWDAGCGFAQVGLWLAQAGHQLTLCDLSRKMLDRAQQNFAQAGIKAQFLHGASQDLANDLPEFDLVLFHAVLEWLADPKTTLQTVAHKTKPGGYLSLLFYNRNAFVYSNVLKGEWRWPLILQNTYIGKGKKLTPPNPQYPHDVLAWLTHWGFEVEVHTGIRVFNDYIRPDILEKSDDLALLELEYQYCRLPTYRDMGRYVHLLAKRRTE